MNIHDNNYLLIQFQLKIYTYSATQFQNFFEKIMEKRYPDFQIIRPYGSIGDGGNDGYRKESGVYYQVYAPRSPQLKDLDAANKMENDFHKLNNNWYDISTINEYNFVFNDKFSGSTKALEERISKLTSENPKIKFSLFLSNDLKKEFFKLTSPELIELGFDIEQRSSVKNAHSYLDVIEKELDRENPVFAQRILTQIRPLIIDLSDENLSLEYEIIECKCESKLERIEEAKNKYKKLSTRYPDDPRPILYLAELYLNDKDWATNEELIDKAMNIDSNNWLVKSQLLLRQLNIHKQIDIKNIETVSYIANNKPKSILYSIYSLGFEIAGDSINAYKLIEKAIKLNPERLQNYLSKLSIIETELIRANENSERKKLATKLLQETREIEEKFNDSDLQPRLKAYIQSHRLIPLLELNQLNNLTTVAKQVIQNVLQCYFDKNIEAILTEVLQIYSEDETFLIVLEYLRGTKIDLSHELSKVLFLHFMRRKSLSNEGKQFFTNKNNKQFVTLINDVNQQNEDNVVNFINNDIPFSIAFVTNPDCPTGLRKKIINYLPDDNRIKKDNIIFYNLYQEGNFSEAFKLLQTINLSQIDYFECRPMIEVASQEKAWDIEIKLIEILLQYEQDKKEIFNIRFQLLIAYLNLHKYKEVIEIGEELLNINSKTNFLNQEIFEGLLTDTLYAYLERGKINKIAFTKAVNTLEKYINNLCSFEFRCGIETEVYIQNKQFNDGLNATINGIKIKKVLHQQEYARLYFNFIIFGNQIKSLNTDSLDSVKENSFVKLSGTDKWYFIGEENELDALKISKNNILYKNFINKKCGEEVSFTNAYAAEAKKLTIELIYSIKKYILWQVIYNFENQADDGILEGVIKFSIPKNQDSVDLSSIIHFYQDIEEKREPLFNKYCSSQIPLYLLTISEGGLNNAIGKIYRERNGYIHCSLGPIEELEHQKRIARNTINQKTPFSLDGTTAFFLSEANIFKKIHEFIPNLIVPQSIIEFLANLAAKYNLGPGESESYFGFSQGQIHVSELNSENCAPIYDCIISTIEILEAKPDNIIAVSPENRFDCLSERDTLSEFNDACIIAQRENIPVLTEDFLYLKLNEYETKKVAPNYFSSFALLRVLYEDGFIPYSIYLDYFSYLSMNRFRFLPISSDDIEKALFGESKIMQFTPENIKKFNFTLTLSEEYGVSSVSTLKVLSNFLIKVIMDNAITNNYAEAIMLELMANLPQNINKANFSQSLITLSAKIIENKKTKLVAHVDNKNQIEKIKTLMQITQLFNSL